MRPTRPVAAKSRRPLLVAATATGVAVVVGNGFVGRESLAWFRSLRRPRGMPTMPVFMAVGAAYYLAMTTVLYRSLRRRDRRATRLAVGVRALNEPWNVAFFGRRSTRNGFVGTAAFTAPPTGLLTAVRHDPVSRNLVGGYTAWVAYDLWWSHGLWKLHP